MGNKRSTFGRILIGCALALATMFAAGAGLIIGARYTPPPIVASTPTERRALNLMVFDAVWTRIDREYYDQSFGGRDWDAIGRHYRPLAASATDPGGLYYEVMTPMLNSLGSSHLRVSPPRTGRLFDFDGSAKPRLTIGARGQGFGSLFERTGLSFIMVDGHQVVGDVRNHSPAERAGIAPGWRLAGFRSIRESNDVVFTLVPPGEKPVQLTLSNDHPTPPRMPYGFTRLVDGPIVLRFDNFKPVTIDWVLDQLGKAPARGVVLDLRGNAGGPVIQNRRLMSALLPHHSPTQVVIDSEGPRVRRTPKDAQIYTGPLAILIGPDSASSAEVVASAVRWNRRGPVVGQRSAGALLVARRWRLPDGGWVTVAVEDFRAPDGRRIENVGVPPTVPASQTLAAIRQDRDLVIEAAVKALAKPN